MTSCSVKRTLTDKLPFKSSANPINPKPIPAMTRAIVCRTDEFGVGKRQCDQCPHRPARSLRPEPLDWCAMTDGWARR